MIERRGARIEFWRDSIAGGALEKNDGDNLFKERIALLLERRARS